MGALRSNWEAVVDTIAMGTRDPSLAAALDVRASGRISLAEAASMLGEPTDAPGWRRKLTRRLRYLERDPANLRDLQRLPHAHASLDPETFMDQSSERTRNRARPLTPEEAERASAEGRPASVRAAGMAAARRVISSASDTSGRAASHEPVSTSRAGTPPRSRAIRAAAPRGRGNPSKRTSPG